MRPRAFSLLVLALGLPALAQPWRPECVGDS